MGQKININLKTVFLAGFAAFALAVASLVLTAPAAEAQSNACSTLPSTQGLATHNESGVAAGEYTAFARVKVASGAATFVLSIDGDGGSQCDLQVSQNGSNGNWVWYEAPSAFSWSGGDMRFQMSGNKAGVGLDCIVLYDLTEGDFNPTSAADCNPPDAPGDDGNGNDGNSDSNASDSGNADNSGCTPVAFLTVIGAISAFNNGGSLSGPVAELDANSNGEMDFLEVIGAISKFNNNQCP